MVSLRFKLVLWGGLVAALWAAASSPAKSDDHFSWSYGMNQLVVSQVDALRKQIRWCWKVPAMTMRKDLNIHIRIRLRPDGTVKSANVLEKSSAPRYLLDPYYRSLAKTARHAILSRACNPLKIPRETLRKGKPITLTLNPLYIFNY